MIVLNVKLLDFPFYKKHGIKGKVKHHEEAIRQIQKVDIL